MDMLSKILMDTSLHGILFDTGLPVMHRDPNITVVQLFSTESYCASAPRYI